MPDSARAFDERHRLTPCLQALGLSSDDRLIDRLWSFTALLLKWNRTYNLTGARDETALVREHLIDSLAAVPVLTSRLTSASRDEPFLVDVGSGAGFPGIVVATVHPEWSIALVEPNSKKAAFLRQAVATLGLPHVHPIGARLQATETILTDLSPSASTVRHFTCRAVASLADLVALIRPLAQAQSRLFALKSRHVIEELTAYPFASVHSLHIPTLDHERTVVEMPLFPPDSPTAAGSPPSR